MCELSKVEWLAFHSVKHSPWNTKAAGAIFHLNVSSSNISDTLVMLTVMDDANIAANDPEPQHRSFLPSTPPPKSNKLSPSPANCPLRALLETAAAL